MFANGVFEGGGVKGIGIVGAVCHFEEMGYKWNNLAGTSSGSIIAALLAVGYSGKDIKKLLLDLNYKIFMDKTKLQSLPLIGSALGMVFQKGIYSGNEIEVWMESLLSSKGKTRFGDISSRGISPLKIIAADITAREIIIIPDDLPRYNMDPMEFKISRAVRMSSSIPLYFRPYKLINDGRFNYIVDGGILSNFPIWIFDSERVPKIPTLGFKIVDPPSHTSLGNTGIISYVLDIINTVIDEDESRCIKDIDLIRTTMIPSVGIKTTDFNISKEERMRLFNAGYSSACEFYETWDFMKYLTLAY